MIAGSMISPEHGIAFFLGLLFIAVFSVAAATLSRGGKLFSGLYTALWYVSFSSREVDFFDYSGAFARQLNLAVPTIYFLAAVSLLGIALLVQERRTT